MIKFIERIDKDTLRYVIENLCYKRNNVKLLSDEIAGTKEDNGSQIVFRNHDGKLIKAVVISYVGVIVEAITLYGKYDLSLKDLIEKYGDYRKVYVPYDDNFEFFFNENRLDGDYVLKTFIDRESFEENNNFHLSNIQLFW